MARYILSIDEGTTGTSALVLDENARVVSTGYGPLGSTHPNPSWVEQDPEEILSSCLHAVSAAMESAGITRYDLVALGITNQRETTILFDASTGKAVAPAIVWQCRRTADICNRLRQDEALSTLIRERTGLVIDPYFSATKIMWMLEKDPSLRERAGAVAGEGDLRFTTVEGWLLWNLTGLHVTEPSNASRTMLFDIVDGTWSNDIAGKLGIPMGLLPRVRDSQGDLGTVLAPGKAHGAAGGLRAALEGVPVRGIAGDQQAALFGHKCFEAGTGKCTFGTGTFLLLNTGPVRAVSANNLITTIGWRVDGKIDYALEGSSFICGSGVDWLGRLGAFQDVTRTSEMARSIENTGGVHFVPALVGLGAPWWRSDARGAFTGLSLSTTPAHLVRALLESIGFSTAVLVDAMARDSGIGVRELRVDGGVARNDFLLGFIADLLGARVLRSRNPQATALGAAYLAGIGVGLWTRESLPEGQYDVFEPAGRDLSIQLSEWRNVVDATLTMMLSQDA